MNLAKMLAELRAEREQIDAAIAVLERLAASGPKRRGRPPKRTSMDQNTQRDRSRSVRNEERPERGE